MDTHEEYEEYIEAEANARLLRLIPEAYRTLPVPEAARLDRIEDELLRRAVRCRSGGADKAPSGAASQPRSRPIPWWLLGLGLVAASAAAWWAGGVHTGHGGAAILPRPALPVEHTAPAATDAVPPGPRRSAAPDPGDTPAPPKSPVIFSR